MIQRNFEERLRELTASFHPVVPCRETDLILLMDFTSANTELDEKILADTELFTKWVQQKLDDRGALYGVGGYDEHRTIYSRSEVFGPVHSQEEPRRLHLGIDIWGPVGVPVMSPIQGEVHSFAFNDAFGDYGATLVLEHDWEELHFYTLYGHLSLDSIRNKVEGQKVGKGETIAFFGDISENGHWPPHLHFQVIRDMQGNTGDYPGVCKFSERAAYLHNCPDPDIFLNMMKRAQ